MKANLSSIITEKFHGILLITNSTSFTSSLNLCSLFVPSVMTSLCKIVFMRKFVNNDFKANNRSVKTNHLIVYIFFSLWFQARVALYHNESKTEILSLVFNATNSSKLSWFSRDRLTHSPWNDLYTETPLGFSVQGEFGRNFYIIKSHGGCSQDFGWLAVTSNQCAWETRFSLRTVIYSNHTSFTHWNDYGT